MFKSLKNMFFILSFAIPSVLLASNDHHHHEHEKHEEKETKSHESHEHGVAGLFMVAENQQLFLTLNSPAYNLYGFEYQATTDKEKQTVESVHKSLQDGVFNPDEKAQCTLRSTGFGDFLKLYPEESVVKKTEHDHSHHTNKPENEEKEAIHSDVEVTWSYHCENTEKLKMLQVKIFSVFPEHFNELKVSWLLGHTSGSHVLKEDEDINLLAY